MAGREKAVIASDLLNQLPAGRGSQAVFSKEGLFDDLKRALAGTGADGRSDSRTRKCW